MVALMMMVTMMVMVVLLLMLLLCLVVVVVGGGWWWWVVGAGCQLPLGCWSRRTGLTTSGPLAQIGWWSSPVGAPLALLEGFPAFDVPVRLL